MKIADLFEWREPKKMTTKNGPMLLTEAPVKADFWPKYNADKAAFREAFQRAGVRLTECKFPPKDGAWKKGDWIAQLWQNDHAAIKAASQAYTDSFKASSDIDFPIADGFTAFPYQLGGAEFIKKNQRVLIADDMGLGKTLQTILYANHDPDVHLILVVVPPNLKINWRREIRKFSTRDPEIITMKTGPKGGEVEGRTARIHHRRKHGQTYVICGYTMLMKWSGLVHGIDWDMVIIDESHYIKNPKAARSKAVVGEYCRKERRNVGGVEARIKVALTGTPIENRPVEIIAALCWLDRILEFGGPYKFKQRYCAAVKTEFGTDSRGWSNEEELNRKLRSTGIMIRRMKRDVLKQIPAKRKQILPLDVDAEKFNLAEERAMEGTKTGQIFKQLKTMDAGEDGQKYLDLVRKLQSAFAADFATLSKVRQELAIKKLPFTVEHLLNALDSSDDKIIVGCIHIACIDGFMEALEKKGIKAVRYQGSMSETAKMASVDAFQDGDAQVFIGQTLAAGVGLNMTAARHVIHHEQDWSPGKMDQFEDRACRIGQEYSILCQTIVVDGGFDSYIANLLADKQTGINEVLNVNLDERDADKARDMERMADFVKEVAEGKDPLAEQVKARMTNEVAEVLQVKKGLEAELGFVPKKAIEPRHTPGQRQRLLQGIRQLSAWCDGATERDNMGFSAFDVGFGNYLAEQDDLNATQAEAAERMVRKYRRQLGEDYLPWPKK